MVAQEALSLPVVQGASAHPSSLALGLEANQGATAGAMHTPSTPTDAWPRALHPDLCTPLLGLANLLVARSRFCRLSICLPESRIWQFRGAGPSSLFSWARNPYSGFGHPLHHTPPPFFSWPHLRATSWREP